MIIKNAFYKTYKIEKDSSLINDIENDMAHTGEFSFKLEHCVGHLLIEMSKESYYILEKVFSNNRPIDFDYYICDLILKKKNLIKISGIVIPYHFLRDNVTITMFFSKKELFDRAFNIYTLHPDVTYFSYLKIKTMYPPHYNIPTDPQAYDTTSYQETDENAESAEATATSDGPILDSDKKNYKFHSHASSIENARHAPAYFNSNNGVRYSITNDFFIPEKTDEKKKKEHFNMYDLDSSDSIQPIFSKRIKNKPKNSENLEEPILDLPVMRSMSAPIKKKLEIKPIVPEFDIYRKAYLDRYGIDSSQEIQKLEKDIAEKFNSIKQKINLDEMLDRSRYVEHIDQLFMNIAVNYSSAVDLIFKLVLKYLSSLS